MIPSSTPFSGRPGNGVVLDTGGGNAAEERPRAFPQVFRQEGATTARRSSRPKGLVFRAAPACLLCPDMTARTPRILISDELDPAALEVFRRAGFEPEVRTGLSEDELCEVIRGADALVVRSATKVTRRVIEAANELRVIGRAGIGVDNVDLEAATERGVVVMNTPT